MPATRCCAAYAPILAPLEGDDQTGEALLRPPYEWERVAHPIALGVRRGELRSRGCIPSPKARSTSPLTLHHRECHRAGRAGIRLQHSLERSPGFAAD